MSESTNKLKLFIYIHVHLKRLSLLLYDNCFCFNISYITDRMYGIICRSSCTRYCTGLGQAHRYLVHSCTWVLLCSIVCQIYDCCLWFRHTWGIRTLATCITYTHRCGRHIPHTQRTCITDTMSSAIILYSLENTKCFDLNSLQISQLTNDV